MIPSKKQQKRETKNNQKVRLDIVRKWVGTERTGDDGGRLSNAELIAYIEPFGPFKECC